MESYSRSVPCPNNGRCGSKSHYPGSLAYRDCLESTGHPSASNSKLTNDYLSPPSPSVSPSNVFSKSLSWNTEEALEEVTGRDSFRTISSGGVIPNSRTVFYPETDYKLRLSLDNEFGDEALLEVIDDEGSTARKITLDLKTQGNFMTACIREADEHCSTGVSYFDRNRND